MIKKVRLATVWLDGCSGCHMSLLDIDEAILAIAKRVDVVYGPLVDAQEFPKQVDVTLIEGAVSSQDDLEKVHTIRRWSKLVVALGDCACDGGIFGESYASAGRVSNVIPVDLVIPGCPPPPLEILRGILAAVRRRS